MGLEELVALFGPRIVKHHGRLDDKQLAKASKALSQLRAKGVNIEGKREG